MELINKKNPRRFDTSSCSRIEHVHVASFKFVHYNTAPVRHLVLRFITFLLIFSSRSALMYESTFECTRKDDDKNESQ